MTKREKSSEDAGYVPHLDESHDLLVTTTKYAIERLCDRGSPDFDEGFYEWLKNRKEKRGKKSVTHAELEAIGISYWAYTRFEGMSAKDAMSRLYNHYKIEEIEKIITKANKLEKVKRLYTAMLTNNLKSD